MLGYFNISRQLFATDAELVTPLTIAHLTKREDRPDLWVFLMAPGAINPPRFFTCYIAGMRRLSAIYSFLSLRDAADLKFNKRHYAIVGALLFNDRFTRILFRDLVGKSANRRN